MTYGMNMAPGENWPVRTQAEHLAKMRNDSAFWQAVHSEWSYNETMEARKRGVEGFIADTVDALAEYVRSAGDQRKGDAGWSTG